MISQLFSAGPFWSNPLLQSTVCIAVGLIGSWLLRRRSARAHQVLFLAMIASVAVPAMSMIVRHYELGMFVDKPVVTESRLAEIPIVPIITEYEISPLPAIASVYYPEPIEPEYSIPAATVSSEAKTKLPLSTILIWSWIIVSTILAARLFVTFILGLRTLQRAFPLHFDKLEKALHIAKGKLGIDKPVQVLAGHTVSSPIIWCWSRRPALLVPAEAEQFEDSIDWIGMFCHELAHWSRLDHISGLFAELMVCVFPWHPLMWWAKRRLAGLSEQACDDWVVAGSRSPTDYAESLLDLTPQGQLSFLPAVVGRKNGLENRVRRIIKDKCGNPRLGLCWAVVVILIAACITIGAAFAQTRPADTEHTKECEEILTREKQQLLLEKKQLELLTAQKEFEQLAEELKVQQIQHDELQYQMNLQKQADDLYRELEALKNYQADKAQLHDQMSATIKEINKARQKFGTTVPDEPVHSDSRLQDSERDNLMLFKHELQTLQDRTRQQLDGLPKEADKLRDKLKEIEAMIQSIDSRLLSVRHQQKLIDDSHTEQEMAQHQELAAERRAFIAERQALQLLAQEIEGKLKTAPEREDAEKLKEILEEYRKRIQKIDSTLSSPQWCPEKRKAEQLKKPKIPTDVGSLTEKQKSDTSCSSCHADIDHIEVHRKPGDTDYAIAELKSRESAEWWAEMRAFEADVVTAKRIIRDVNAVLENDQAILKQINQEIKIFISEHGANLGSNISLYNKLKTMEANREQLSKKIERDKVRLAKYQEELKAAVERRNIYLKYKPPASTEEEDIQRFIKAMEALKRRMEGQWRTTPPSQQGQAHSPREREEKLQSRINQLQDEIRMLRSEMTEMRKLMKEMVEHEKKRPKKPLPEIHDYPLEPENIEPAARGKRRQEHPPDDMPIGLDEIETTESPPPAD